MEKVKYLFPASGRPARNLGICRSLRLSRRPRYIARCHNHAPPIAGVAPGLCKRRARALALTFKTSRMVDAYQAAQLPSLPRTEGWENWRGCFAFLRQFLKP